MTAPAQALAEIRATLVGVGVGPGDPELVTVKAIRILKSADVVFVPVSDGSGPYGPPPDGCSAPGSPMASLGRAEATVRAHVSHDRIRRLPFRMTGDADYATPAAAVAAALTAASGTTSDTTSDEDELAADGEGEGTGAGGRGGSAHCGDELGGIGVGGKGRVGEGEGVGVQDGHVTHGGVEDGSGIGSGRVAPGGARGKGVAHSGQRFGGIGGGRGSGLGRGAGDGSGEIRPGGRVVAFATIGDPNVYSTFTQLAAHVRAVAPGVAVETVPGIMALQDLAARSGTVLAHGTETLALMPLTAGVDAYRRAVADHDTVVAYKGGRALPQVLAVLDEAGRLDGSCGAAVYGASLGLPDSDIRPAGELPPEPGPYLSTVIATQRPLWPTDSADASVDADVGAKARRHVNPIYTDTADTSLDPTSDDPALTYPIPVESFRIDTTCPDGEDTDATRIDGDHIGAERTVTPETVAHHVVRVGSSQQPKTHNAIHIGPGHLHLGPDHVDAARIDPAPTVSINPVRARSADGESADGAKVDGVSEDGGAGRGRGWHRARVRGRVTFVGAGPGAGDLLTLRGARVVAEADLVVWASSLVHPDVVAHARSGAQVVDSAGIPLETIAALYRRAADDGLHVARVHSGDPTLWGAVQEQLEICAELGLATEIVPGVSSVTATAAAVQRELTVPEVAQTVILTRLGGGKTPMPPREQVRELARHGTTMALFLSTARSAQLQRELLDGGYSTDTPCVVAYRVSWPEELVVRCTLGDLAVTVKARRLWKHTLVLVGPALAAGGTRSHLYHPGHFHGFRRAEPQARADLRAHERAHDAAFAQPGRGTDRPGDPDRTDQPGRTDPAKPA